MNKRQLFLVVQAVLWVIWVVLVATAAIGIYRSGIAYQAAGNPGADIYTREKVVEALAPYLPLFACALIMTIVGLVAGIRDERIDIPVKDVEITRDLITARISEPTEAMLKEEALQKKLFIAGWVLFGVSMIPILLYITNADHFAGTDPAGLESVIGALVKNIVPWTIIGIGALAITSELRAKSMVRETEAAKEYTGERKSPAKSEDGSGNRKVFNYIRIAVLVAAVVMIALGVRNGSMNDVLYKAVNICTECVGLG